MTMFAKWAVAGLLLPNALEAFLPSSSSSTSTRTSTTTTLYATINATETPRKADPFLNNFLDGPSSSSRFVRYDKRRDKASLVDTSTDDFINKYNSGGLGRKPTGGNSKTINRDGSVKIESLGASSGAGGGGFSSNKFERYDKKKFGNLILGQENENKNKDDFVNKRNPTQSSIHVNNNNNIQEGSSYPQHMAKSTQQSSSSSSSATTVNLDGVELKRFNWKEDKSLFSSPSSSSTPAKDEFVQDPRMAATARKPPKSPPNDSRIRRGRQENVSFPRTPGSSTTPSGKSYYPKTTPSASSSSSNGRSYYPKTTSSSSNNNELDWLKQREQRGGQELSSSNTPKPKSHRAPDDWLSQRDPNDEKKSWQAAPVQLENVYQAPPPPEPQDTTFRPGRFVTRSGADVSQHISDKKGPDSVMRSAFSVSERKPVRPERAVRQSSSRRPTSSTSGQRKPVMPAATPSLKRDFYRTPEQVQAARKATYTSQPPPARPVPPQQQENSQISELDARVLRELLQTENLDSKTEAALVELLEKERSSYAAPPQQQRRPRQPERRPTMPRGQEPERRPTMPKERRPNTPQMQERSPTMPQQERSPTMPQREPRPSMERGPVMPREQKTVMPTSSRTGTKIPPRRRRTASSGEDEEARKARQKLQAERNRAALLEQYNSISDEEMIMYGMKVSGNQQVEPESKSLPPPPKYGWNEYGIEDGFMNNYQEYHSYFEQQEQVQAPTLKETPKAAAKTSAKESDKKDPREGKTESNEWVNLGDPQSPGFMGFSDSEFKLQGGDSSSISSSSEQWWKRNDWDSSQEVVITDYAGDDYETGSVQPQKPEPKAEEPDDNSDGGIPKAKAPGFVGFSNIDWSQQR